ncbi:hypothetical protein [uncultured Desulfobacter sp.]|uniref:hypothetical protein n=1 Tax=uncultured Desulfobacter sp. TaxID=240139 RepID=UPI002AAB72EA|nr:hypothetical protein [uncultured Desulfobacter sp.]
MRRGRMKKACLWAVMFVLMPGFAAMATASIGGKWNVQAVLIAMSHPNDLVKPGHTKQEIWSIVQQGASATLTTPNGSISGRFVPKTQEFPLGAWMFELEVPNIRNMPNLGAKYEVTILVRSENVISGGTSITYMGNNGFGGPWYPIGMESWRFDATRIP